MRLYTTLNQNRHQDELISRCDCGTIGIRRTGCTFPETVKVVFVGSVLCNGKPRGCQTCWDLPQRPVIASGTGYPGSSSQLPNNRAVDRKKENNINKEKGTGGNGCRLL